MTIAGKMNLVLAALRPRLLPCAVGWAEARSQQILESGKPLSDTGIGLARAVGVVHPEKIRVSIVTALPFPNDPELRSAALSAGLLGTGMVGLMLGYGIYVCDGHFSSRVVSHVYQHEYARSISNFLPQYLQKIVKYGYKNARYEADARNHEIDVVAT